MKHKIIITENHVGLTSDIVLEDESHTLTIKIDNENSDVYLDFSSRESLRDFAKSLLYASYFGCGQDEYYPLCIDNHSLVVNGARLTPESSRMFVFYPNEITLQVRT